MSLQTDLQTAIAKVTADGALLHDIVHGDAASTVVTESGPVKTVAKAIADVVAAFGDVDSARTTTLGARDQAVAGAAQVAADTETTLDARDAAAASATSAAASAQAAQVAKIMWQGVWDGALAYANRDAVTLNGASYVCRQPHTNHQPPNAAYWDLLAAKGDTGPAANLGNGVPQALGNAATGAANFASREDHVHARGALVDGPANATDGELVRFDGATGKLIKGGDKIQADDIAAGILGSVAAKNTGTAPGQVPLVQADGRLPASVMPPNDGATLFLLSNGF